GAYQPGKTVVYERARNSPLLDTYEIVQSVILICRQEPCAGNVLITCRGRIAACLYCGRNFADRFQAPQCITLKDPGQPATAVSFVLCLRCSPCVSGVQGASVWLQNLCYAP